MVRWKKDAIRLALFSVAVLAGGTLFVAGIANGILLVRGEPAPSAGLVAGVTFAGLVLLVVPFRITVREMLASRAR